MLVLLSPAKTQNFNASIFALSSTLPESRREITTLVDTLKGYKAIQLEKLMSISPKLAKLNYERFQAFDTKHFTLENAQSAIYVFQGDAYRSLAIDQFSNPQISYAQDHLLILSGLYGYLRPLDLIQAYRLEMHTRLPIGNFRNLYEFWGDKITTGINKHIELHQHKLVINLASDEYFQAVQPEKLHVPIINIQFKEKRGDSIQTIGINAKRARGMMTRFIMANKIKKISDLKKFNEENYQLTDAWSTNDSLCFIR